MILNAKLTIYLLHNFKKEMRIFTWCLEVMFNTYQRIKKHKHSGNILQCPSSTKLKTFPNTHETKIHQCLWYYLSSMEVRRLAEDIKV